MAAAIPVGDQEIGNGLVEWVAMLGIEPHRIDVGQAEAATRAVGVAGVIAQAVKAFVGPAREIMVRAAVPPAEIIGLRPAIGHVFVLEDDIVRLLLLATGTVPACPIKPLAVPTSLGANTSADSVLISPEII